MKLSIAAAAVLVAVSIALPAAARKDKDEKTPVLRPVDIVSAAPADAWRPIDLENTILMDLPQGEVVIEMRPDIAPKTVAQIKTLVRRHFYDDLNFHRVIEGFVAQGGDPKGDGTGGSDLPDIPAEFTHDTKEIPDFAAIGRDRMAARVGFIDGLPAAAQPESLRSFREDKHVEVWGAHCPGVMSMARATDPNSANSQFFLVIGDARQNLDRRYAVWGWVVAGFDNTRRIARGDPPKRPTPILRMRIAADVPDNEKPHVQVMKTDSDSFRKYLEAAGAVKDGFVRDLCSIKTPRKVNGKIELQ